MTGSEWGFDVDGAEAIARGATGRWCGVMWAGPTWLKKHNIIPFTPEEARKEFIGETDNDYLELQEDRIDK